MAFELGITLSKPIEEQLIATLREKIPALREYSNEEIARGRFRVAEDAIRRGAFVTDLERVRANYSEWPNVEIVQGIVPEVLPTIPVKSVAFLHIDMNCAYPERAALEHFWDLLSPGAMARDQTSCRFLTLPLLIWSSWL